MFYLLSHFSYLYVLFIAMCRSSVVQENRVLCGPLVAVAVLTLIPVMHKRPVSPYTHFRLTSSFTRILCSKQFFAWSFVLNLYPIILCHIRRLISNHFSDLVSIVWRWAFHPREEQQTEQLLRSSMGLCLDHDFTITANRTIIQKFDGALFRSWFYQYITSRWLPPDLRFQVIDRRQTYDLTTLAMLEVEPLCLCMSQHIWYR